MDHCEIGALLVGYRGDAMDAWSVNLNDGFVTDGFSKFQTFFVWPVRGGQ